jgi:hypothetical protein
MTDRDLLLTIRDALNGYVWNDQTCEFIAELLTAYGYPVNLTDKRIR